MTKTLEHRVADIEARNNRVETDKAWETSVTRRMTISVMTYLVVATYLRFVAHNDRPLVNACVPVIGYLLSTVIVHRVRNIWERR